MNLENKQSIDEIINHILDSNNGKINDTVLNQLIEIKNLALEEQKNNIEYELKQKEIDLKIEENRVAARQERFPHQILSNTVTTAVIAALAGFLISNLVPFIHWSSQFKELNVQISIKVVIGNSTYRNKTLNSSCYIAAYSHQKEGSLYSVGNNIYLMGEVRVPGHYQGRVCQPNGYVGMDISGLDSFKELFDQKLPKTCKNKSCWAGGDTGSQG